MIDFLFDVLFGFLGSLVSIFPNDPFASYINGLSVSSFGDGIGWINWLVDLPTVALITAAWVSAVLVICVYRLVLRFLSFFKEAPR